MNNNKLRAALTFFSISCLFLSIFFFDSTFLKWTLFFLSFILGVSCIRMYEKGTYIFLLPYAFFYLYSYSLWSTHIAEEIYFITINNVLQQQILTYFSTFISVFLITILFLPNVQSSSTSKELISNDFSKIKTLLISSLILSYVSLFYDVFTVGYGNWVSLYKLELEALRSQGIINFRFEIFSMFYLSCLCICNIFNQFSKLIRNFLFVLYLPFIFFNLLAGQRDLLVFSIIILFVSTTYKYKVTLWKLIKLLLLSSPFIILMFIYKLIIGGLRTYGYKYLFFDTTKATLSNEFINVVFLRNEFSTMVYKVWLYTNNMDWIKADVLISPFFYGVFTIIPGFRSLVINQPTIQQAYVANVQSIEYGLAGSPIVDMYYYGSLITITLGAVLYAGLIYFFRKNILGKSTFLSICLLTLVPLTVFLFYRNDTLFTVGQYKQYIMHFIIIFILFKVSDIPLRNK